MHPPLAHGPDPVLPSAQAPEPVVAVLGGTGDQGRGLAHRFAAAGVPVVVGSRDAERAQRVAAELSDRGRTVTGSDNASAAAAGDVVIVAVPWDGHRQLLESLAAPLARKVVVDCVNPLGFDARGPYPLPVEEGSAVEQAAAVLPDSRVVGAFHHVSALLLADRAIDRIETDVLVVGDDREAAEVVITLAGRIPGMRGIYAGRLRNAGQVEALTANLIAINRRYRTVAGIRVTGA